MSYVPQRGDHFELWLKTVRDSCKIRGSHAFDVVGMLLDDYRLHADTHTPLGDHVCEGGCNKGCWVVEDDEIDCE